MTRKKKTAIVFLVLLGIVLVPLLFLKVWASYRLGQVNAQQTAQGTLISQELQERKKTPPEGKNLFEQPLWLNYLKEITGGGNYMVADSLSASNALSRWCAEQSGKRAYYQSFQPQAEPELEPQVGYLRPGYLGSTQRELLPTFETLQKGLKRVYDKAVPSDLRPMVEKYQAREDLSDEEKVLGVFREYFQSEKPAVEEEIKKSLAESSFFGISEEIYTKLGVSEEEYFHSPLNPSASLKTLAFHYGQTARLHAYSGQREKTLEELKPLLDLASLKGFNSTPLEGMYRCALRILSANTVHAIILEDVLNEEDLLSIQTRFSQMNMMEDLLKTLEGWESFCEIIFRYNLGLISEESFWPRFIVKLAHFSGYIDLNKAAILDLLRGARAAIDTEGQTLDYAAWKKAVDLPKSIFNILARPMIPGDGKASNAFLRVQSYRDAVILGCALERYRLKVGSFPEKLEALIPEYLPQMPKGSLSQGSISYTRTEKGYELILNKLPELPKEDNMETIWRR